MNRDPWLECADYIFAALVREMAKRPSNPAWIAAERTAVAVAANEWAASHGLTATMTVDDVEALETTAVGHVDYARKLTLRLAERVLGFS